MQPLPVIWPNFKDQRYSCHSCTNCCRDLVVHLTLEDRRKIDAQGYAAKLGAPPYVRLESSYVLNHGPDGACISLQTDGLCRIHAEHGMAAKPLACHVYPFTLERDREGLQAGIRF